MCQAPQSEEIIYAETDTETESVVDFDMKETIFGFFFEWIEFLMMESPETFLFFH